MGRGGQEGERQPLLWVPPLHTHRERGSFHLAPAVRRASNKSGKLKVSVWGWDSTVGHSTCLLSLSPVPAGAQHFIMVGDQGALILKGQERGDVIDDSSIPEWWGQAVPGGAVWGLRPSSGQRIFQRTTSGPKPLSKSGPEGE